MSTIDRYVPPPCPKCGADGDHRIGYVRFDRMAACWDRPNGPDGLRCWEVIARPGGGHWHVTCHRCRFMWVEPADTPELVAAYQRVAAAAARLAEAEKGLTVAVRRRRSLRRRYSR